MKKSVKIILLLLTLCGASITKAQNFIDLKASYCIAYINSNIATVQSFIEEIKRNGTEEMKKSLEKSSGLDKLKNSKNRLLRYLDYRTENLDANSLKSLITAQHQFYDDEKLTKIWFEKNDCGSLEKFNDCSNKYKKEFSLIIAKQAECSSLEWLPF